VFRWVEGHPVAAAAGRPARFFFNFFFPPSHSIFCLFVLVAGGCVFVLSWAFPFRRRTRRRFPASRDPGTRPAGVEGLGTPGLRPAGVARESGVPRAAFATEPLNPALGAGSSRCLTGLGGSGAGWRSTPHAPILRPGDGCGMGKW
jgi:hypothetical protein